MAEAAVFAMRYAPDIIDINMGCPAPKIAGNGSGAALMFLILGIAGVMVCLVFSYLLKNEKWDKA